MLLDDGWSLAQWCLCVLLGDGWSLAQWCLCVLLGDGWSLARVSEAAAAAHGASSGFISLTRSDRRALSHMSFCVPARCVRQLEV